MRALSILLLALAFTIHTASGWAQTPALSANADVDALVRVLQDDTARATLLQRLTAEAPPPVAVAAEPIVLGFVGRIAETTRDAARGLLVWVQDLRWVAASTMVTLQGAAEIDMGRVGRASVDVFAVIAVTFLVYGLLRWGGMRLGQGLDRRAEAAGRIRRAVLLAAASAIDLLGVLLAWGGGYLFVAGVGGLQFDETAIRPGSIGFTQALFLNAFLIVELVKAVLRLLVMPVRSHLRLLPLSDADARYWYSWPSRLTSLIGYAFMFAAPLLLYAGAWSAAQSVRILVMLTAVVLVVRIVLQMRGRGRRALSRRLQRGQTDTIAHLSAAFGAIWHVPAIAYAVAVFVVWLTNPYTALPFMLQATGLSALAVLVGIAAFAGISRLISRGLRLPGRLRERLPLLEARLNALVPAVLRALRMAALIGVLLTVGQVWGLIDIYGWAASPAGKRFVAAIVSAGVIVLMGWLLYLAAASWVEYRLNPNFGSVPTARERTLLALFRNAFSIALAVVVAMLALSELGVNIAPLLAGAGVLGLAIGFGAQKLVQDIITGLFIQFENAMNEGEVVKIGEVSGLVERLTIRSASIRDFSGVLHIVPFSAVDRVSNFMRHFSCHVAEISVAYRENIAEVKEAMQDAFARLQNSEHGPYILDTLEMCGLSEFGESGIKVLARIRTLPGRHWGIGRAYNEFIKEVFDERGIEIPFPHLTVYMGADRAGNAPPLHILQTPQKAAARAA